MSSIYEALELIRQIDPGAAITYNSIRKICLKTLAILWVDPENNFYEALK